MLFSTLLFISSFLLWCTVTRGQNLSDSQIAAVVNTLADAAQLSWELGTRAEAILEYSAPGYSVFSPTSVPPPQSIPSNITAALAPVFSMASKTVGNVNFSTNTNTSTNTSVVTTLAFLNDDNSSGDSASIGVAVLIANWTGQGSVDNVDYATAANNQIDYLFNNAPRTSDGAISHRVDDLQLWSDSVYMTPPFIAYYGVVTQNSSRLKDAYDQISLYRNYLSDPSANGLWKHIVLGTNIPQDFGHWSTGNAWAAAGMCRVLATMKHSQYASDFQSEMSDLAAWVKEIHTAMYANLDATSIFRNYADNSSTFYDAASTALLASTVYRAAALTGDGSHIPFAEASRIAISSPNATQLSNGNYGSATAHITSDGWLNPVVDPHDFANPGNQSAEGQAFVIEMHAAWRDWHPSPGAVSSLSSPKNDATKLTNVAGWLAVSALVSILAT